MIDRAVLLNELRYAERICERQARLYRRGQFVSGWLSIVGATATVAAVASHLPHWAQLTLSMIAAGLGIAFHLMRLGDKAAVIEAQKKIYGGVRTAANLEHALDVARSTAPPQLEALRMVCFNDVLREIGRADEVQKLCWWQRLIGAVA